ncbi:MAG: CRISPR-associated protein Cas4 [Candidatus Didemnitutus sp.]|nr:CRISPR-associated protein Cas4 [Candidatus Didemnitutus sp.]
MADFLIQRPFAAPETIPLSALNHHLYCERRAYLIHVERVFVDNEHTLLGDLAHEAVDTPGYEHRAGWEILRALPLYSDTLGLTGKADLVEIRRGTPGASQIANLKSQIHDRPPVVEARPVEYKKGPARRWSNDQVQLCAQALCLEEMFGLRIPAGLIYHVASAKRDEVAFDEPLRALTLATLDALRASLARAAAPLAVLKPQCDGCSLRGICLPEAAIAPSRRTTLFEPREY